MNGISQGSGAIVEKFQTGFLVLTADHVCESDVELPDSIKPYATVKTKMYVKDYDNNKTEAIVFKKDKLNDICLIYVGKQTDFPKIKFSKNAPEQGDRVFNIAAPGGIFDYRMVPIFEGFYSGKAKVKNHLVDVYSIYSSPGSSGSVVLNHYGEMIGMIHSGFAAVNYVSLSVTYDVLKDFIASGVNEIKDLTKS